MPTDQAHLIAFVGTLAGYALASIGFYVYVVRTTPKRRPGMKQLAFDLTARPPEAAAPPHASPLARA
jgi:hypothetical protein